VTDTSGNPLAGIEVWATVASGEGSYTAPVATTDTTGHYVSQLFTPSSVTVQFRDPTGPYLAAFYGPEPGSPVEVIGGQVTPAIDGQLTAGGTVSGTLRDPDGNPLADACVTLVTTSGMDSGWAHCSDASGHYRTSGAPAGTYYLRVESWNYPQPFPRQYLGGTLTTDGATELSVVAGSDLSGTDYQVVLGGVISGRITAADTGAGVWANVSVVSGGEYNWVASATTAPDGSYRVVGLPTGTYQVQITPDSGYAAEWYHDQAAYAEATPVEVTFGAATTVDESVVRDASVSGVLSDQNTGAPIPNAWVRLYTPPVNLPGAPPGMPGFTSFGATSGLDGRFTIQGIPVGDYLLSAGAVGYVAEWYRDAASFTEAQVLSIGIGDSLTADINLQPESVVVLQSIAGTVTSERGDPLVGAVVEAYLNGAEFPTAAILTGANGEYLLPGLQPGDYQVRFVGPDQGAYVPEWFDNVTDPADATVINGSTPVGGTNASLRPAPPVAATGVITDARTGLPIEGSTCPSTSTTRPMPRAPHPW